MDKPAKPNCYQCIHRGTIPADTHSCCANLSAKVTGNAHGIRKGWFFWPLNFDPVWLDSCDGFSPQPHSWSPWHPSKAVMNTNVRICLNRGCEEVNYSNPPDWMLAIDQKKGPSACPIKLEPDARQAVERE